MATKRVFGADDDTCGYFNSWELTPGFRGDLPNLTKDEFTELMFRYMDEAENMTDRQTIVFEFPDGRRLRFYHRHFLAEPQNDLTELREWSVESYTLDQRTPRCLRRWKHRKAWVYYHPYQGEGYKRRGKYAYKVWW